MSGVSRARWPRALLLWLHVVTGVGWMSQALALFTLLVVGSTATAAATRLSAYAMAERLDEYLLLHMANASAFTGLMLSALTAWGYFRYWWVLAKFVITLTQLYLGIFVLSPGLAASVAAAEHGREAVGGLSVAAPLLMAAAIGFQAWLSVAKPWKRTPWAAAAPRRRRPADGHAERHADGRTPLRAEGRADRRRGDADRPPAVPGWVFAGCAAVPPIEYALGTFVLGFPVPFLSLLIAIGYPLRRAGISSRGGPAEHLAR